MYTDQEFIVELASSSASLDKSPKKNWVENAGGLPPYVRKLARGIMKSGGHDLSSSIAIALSRIKVWAGGGGDVNADTRAKAAAALAQWEAAKAKSHVKLTYDTPEGEFSYIMLSSAPSYNTEIVRTAFDATQQVYGSSVGGYNPSREWVAELGSDYVIAYKDSGERLRYGYSVNDDLDVEFGKPVKIRQVWVEDFSDDERTALSNIPAAKNSLDNIVKLSQTLRK